MPRTTHTIKAVSREGRGTYYQTKIHGRQVYLGCRLRDAKAKLRGLLSPSPEEQQARPVTLDGLAARWLEGRPDNEEARLFSFLDFVEGKTLLRDVEPDVLERFHVSMKASRFRRQGKGGKLGPRRTYAAKTIRHYIATPSAMFKWGHARGWIAEVPRMPKTDTPRREPKDIPPDVIAKAINSMRDPSRSVVRFIAGTGCRPGEACALQWDWYRPGMGECGAFIIPSGEHKTGVKTGTSRTIYLTPDARKVIDSKPRAAEMVFVNQLGRPFTSGGIRSVCRRHGVSRPYSLRHSFAQSALESGVRLETVGRLLGHADVKTTSIYAQIRDDKALDAAASLTGLIPEQPVAAPVQTTVASVLDAPRTRPAGRSQG